MDRRHAPSLLALEEIDSHTDTRDYLRRARDHARRHGYDRWTLVDVDAHHVESISWKEIVGFIEDPVLRDQAKAYHAERVGSPPYGLVGDLGLRYQDCGGRIPHQSDQRERIDPTAGLHRDVVLTQRAMEALSVAWMVVFPTSMLFLGMHPQPQMEVALGRAYNRWVAETLLSGDNGIIALAYLPFNTPEAALRVVEENAASDRIVGFTVTSTRYRPVHDNVYMRLYRAIEESGKPICFHAGYHWQDPSLATIPTFLGMHALGFVWCNMVHMTNWILQGIPVRFPRLKSLWVESGLAWLPFLMQRLDDQFLMRQSEAPSLRRLPSEYMAEHCWYSSQPMERGNLKALELTFEMIRAETQLLWSSDWPHFDFDTPAVIHDLPFLTETAKRNILGRNAQRLFDLPDRRPPVSAA
jgi:predicted TIM-barrel fold metal-dependent hydrolase